MKNEGTEYFADWNQCFHSFNLLSPNVQNILRNSAAARLIRDGAEGVGSSDRNYMILAMWKEGQRDWNNVMLNAFEDFLAHEQC